MKRRTLFAYMLVSAFLLSAVAVSVGAAEKPRTWIEPETPQSGEDVKIYYSDPNATMVLITVYKKGGDTAFIRSGHGQEGDTWWIQVSDMPGGDYYYKIDASGPDRYGNHTEVPFHVEGSSNPVNIDEGYMSSVISITVIFLVIVSITILLNNRKE